MLITDGYHPSFKVIEKGTSLSAFRNKKPPLSSVHFNKLVPNHLVGHDNFAVFLFPGYTYAWRCEFTCATFVYFNQETLLEFKQTNCSVNNN